MTRLADGPTVTAHAVVAAPLEVVWALVVDINVPARFSDEFRGADWMDGVTGPAVGARFVGRNWHPAIGEWKATCTVNELEQHRRFGWAVNDAGDPAASWWFELQPTGDRTRLTQGVRLGPGPSGLTVEIDRSPDDEERIVGRRLEEHRVNMQRTVDGIKAAAEAA